MVKLALMLPIVLWMLRPSVPKLLAAAALSAVALSPAMRALAVAQPLLLLSWELVIVGLVALPRYPYAALPVLGAAVFVDPNGYLLLPLLVPSLWVAYGQRYIAFPILIGVCALGALVALDYQTFWRSLWSARSECWTYPLMVLPFLTGCFRWRKGWRTHPLYVFALLFPGYLVLRIYIGSYQSEQAFFALFLLFAVAARNVTEEESDPHWLTAVSICAFLCLLLFQ